MFYVGIDAHDRYYALCILDTEGKVVMETTIKGGPKDVADKLLSLGGPVLEVAYEASLGYGTLYDVLCPVAGRVRVAHPAHLRAIFKARIKNDRIDARKIAKLLYLGEIPEVHVPARPVRGWRGLIEHRSRYVVKRTAVKNALRAILRAEAIVAPRGNKLWTKAGLAWLKGVEFASPFTALRRNQLLRELEGYSLTIAEIEEALDPLVEASEGAKLLMTIPGVGPRTAEAVTPTA